MMQTRRTQNGEPISARFDDIIAEHPIPDGFSVKDEATANWVVRKIVEGRQYAERVKAYAQRELARAEREEQFFLWRFGPQLEAWLLRQLQTHDRPGPPRKSINLPAGSVGLRTATEKLELIDPAAAKDWARTHCPDALTVEEKLSKSALKQHLADTGELPEGTMLTSGREVFYIK